jgi:hypothetical protein
MCRGCLKSFGTKYWNGIILLAGFVVGGVATAIIFSRYTTSSGEDMVDRTRLLI